MNLRYLLLISTLVTACVFSSCSRAGETTNIKQPKDYKAQCDRGDTKACFSLGVLYQDGAERKSIPFWVVSVRYFVPPSLAISGNPRCDY